MDSTLKKIEQYLVIFELISFEHINEGVIKTKYRELARRFHPDITGRDTNKEMADINEANDFLMDNILLVNSTLERLFKTKEERFEKIYREAIIPGFMSATVEMLEKSIRLLKSILNYKDSTIIISKYEAKLQNLIMEEKNKSSLYKESIIDLKSATIDSLRKTISNLNTLGDYKDSKLWIDKCQKRIMEILEQENRIMEIYRKAVEYKESHLGNKELLQLIKDLKQINYKDSSDLLNHYYSRLNLISSITTRLENERKEKKIY